jgi:hypothetical protein
MKLCATWSRTRASWQPYRNESEQVFAGVALKRISTIAFQLAALNIKVAALAK